MSLLEDAFRSLPDAYLIADQSLEVVASSDSVHRCFDNEPPRGSLLELLSVSTTDGEKLRRVLDGDEDRVSKIKVALNCDRCEMPEMEVRRFESGGRVYLLCQLDNALHSLQIRELRRSQQFLNQTLNVMPAVVYSKLADGTYLYVNDRFLEVVGCTREQTLGNTDFDILPSDIADALRINDREIAASGEMQYFEETVPNPKGEDRIYDTYKFPMFDDGNKVFAVTGISIDITERKKLEKEFDEQRISAIHASKMATLGEMAGGISHEVNNPLTIIDGHARKIQRLVKDQSDVQKSCETISMMSDRIATIVQGLRSFARDSEQDPLSLILASRLVDETLAMCEARMRHHQVHINVSPYEDFMLTCRPSQIMQVLLNLISNSFDAVAKDGTGVIEVEIYKLGDRAILAVTDNGGGIPSGLIGKVIQPFFTTKRAGSGMGLGLSITNSIVKSHDGRIDIKSDPRGTRMRVEIPQKQVFRAQGQRTLDATL